MEQLKNLQTPLQYLTDPDPYILTPDEEAQIISHEKRQIIRHRTFRMAEAGVHPETIEQRISDINFDELITDERKKELFDIANGNKHNRIWEADQRKREALAESERMIQLQVKNSRESFKNLLVSRNYTIDQFNQSVVDLACCFFSGTEYPGLDLSKGLWLRGGAGVGKTHTIRILSQNDYKPFTIKSMIDIAAQVQREGFYDINARFIALDDVGSEQATVKHYGTDINWFKDFIELWYAANRPFNQLIITTNCSFDEIESKYGFRVRSRVKDMFNIIDVPGADRRG